MRAAAAAPLGLAEDAAPDEVGRAFKQRLRDAMRHGDEPRAAALREAHALLLSPPVAGPPLALGVAERPRHAHDNSSGACAGASCPWAWGSASRQGRRASNEDFLLCAVPAAGGHAFAVLDGHGGRRAAEHVAAALPALLREAALDDDTVAALWAERAFASLDAGLLDVARADGWDDGCTALVAVARPGRSIVLLQVGDSNAVVCADDGVIGPLCPAHRPSEPAEAARLAAAGWGGGGANERLFGLAVSRALGDAGAKSSGDGRLLVPSPEIRTHAIRPADHLLVLACDGVWDHLSPDAVARAAAAGVDSARAAATSERGHVDTTGADGGRLAQAAAEAIADAALDVGSTDNVSVVCVALRADTG